MRTFPRQKTILDIDREARETAANGFANIAIGVALVFVIVLLVFLFFMAITPPAESASLTASWYSVESCFKEGSSGTMANGRKLNDAKRTAASWDYPFGTVLKVRNLRNGKVVRVEVTDRGPSRRLYRRGRVIDLSMAAFKTVADMREGIIPVTIEED